MRSWRRLRFVCGLEMSGSRISLSKAASWKTVYIVERGNFDCPNSVLRFDVFDFEWWCCEPKSSSVVEDEHLVDFFPAEFLCCPLIFSNASKFLLVRRARLRGLSAMILEDVLWPSLKACLWCFCGGRRDFTVSYIDEPSSPKTISTAYLEPVPWSY